MLTPPYALQALLYAAGDPLPRKRICSVMQISDEMLTVAAQELEAALTGTGLALVQTSSELELRTAPAAAPIIETFTEAERTRDLGKASLETLAIILYREGATRGDIDRIRGVNSTAALRALLLRGLIERSMDDADKRRARYTITMDALAHLGLTSVQQAPEFTQWKQSLTEAEADKTEVGEPA